MRPERNRGFSLIELMVVVAIIGILATLAVPNYTKFQARARQSSAKAELTAIFAAEKSFFAEYGTYHDHWASIGFVPENFNLNVIAGWYPVPLSVTRYYASTPGDQSPPVPTTFAVLALADPAAIFNEQSYGASENRCAAVAISSSWGGPVYQYITATDATMGGSSAYTSQTTFESHVLGCPVKNLPTETGLDRWSINQNRVIRNLDSGL